MSFSYLRADDTFLGLYENSLAISQTVSVHCASAINESAVHSNDCTNII